MVVTTNDLDEEIKETLRTTIMRKLLRTYGTLPLSTEPDKIIAVISDAGAGEHLSDVVAKYYEDLAVKDIHVDIPTADMLQIYLHRV